MPVKEFKEPMNAHSHGVPRWLVVLICLLLLLPLVVSAILWQKVALMQSQLAQQSMQTQQIASDARAVANSAQTTAQTAQAKLSLYSAQIDALSAQRIQLEDLARELNRTRGDNLADNISSSLRLAYQQASVTGRTTLLLNALDLAQKRLAHNVEPRFQKAQKLIAGDVLRIKSANTLDINAALIQFDVVIEMIDGLKFVNSAISAVKDNPKEKMRSKTINYSWWNSAYHDTLDQMKELFRIRRLNNSDGMLITPEQAYFWKENVKLLLLNARLSLLTQNFGAAKTDLARVITGVVRYCDSSSPRTKSIINQLEQLQYRMQASQIPDITLTINALSQEAGK